MALEIRAKDVCPHEECRQRVNASGTGCGLMGWLKADKVDRPLQNVPGSIDIITLQ